MIALAVAVTLPTVGRLRAQETATDDPQKEGSKTTDGVDLAIWYYPSAAEKPLATVMLLHDLEGSHESLEPLARGLQAAGCSVVSPDLRGHGKSRSKKLPTGPEDLSASRLLKADLDAAAASQGGRIRAQALFRGDIETTLLWIREKARSDMRLDEKRLCVVGSGLGGTLATLWAAADANWNLQKVTGPPQGGLVRCLALISPDYSVKGTTVGPALKNPVVARTTPLVILAGESDQDALKIFKQFKQSRPDGWFELGPDSKSTQADKVTDVKKDASVFLFRYATKDSADTLATAGAAAFAPLLIDFFREQLSR